MTSGEYKLDHIHFRVEDYESAKAFWLDAIGAKLVKERMLGGAPSCTFDLNGTKILISGKGVNDELTASISEQQYGYWHVALLVENLESSLQHLKSKNIERLSEPWEIREGVRVAFVNGPDNISVELIERRESYPL